MLSRGKCVAPLAVRHTRIRCLSPTSFSEFVFDISYLSCVRYSAGELCFFFFSYCCTCDLCGELSGWQKASGFHLMIKSQAVIGCKAEK